MFVNPIGSNPTTSSADPMALMGGNAMARLGGISPLECTMQLQMQQMIQLEAVLLSMLMGLMSDGSSGCASGLPGLGGVPALSGGGGLGHLSGGGLAAAPQQPGGKASFNIASFNVLGSSHTAAGGNKPGMASGVQRTRGAVAALQRNHVDIAGLQEFQGDQQKEFRRLAPGYGMAGSKDNAIVWNKQKFQLIEKREVTIPYFEGHPRKMPVVRLQDKQTGKQMWIVNVHNPADTKDHPHNAANRARAVNIEQNLLQQLQGTGLPVLFVGDMNDHSMRGDLSEAGMTASRPGQGEGPIDWIFGSRGVQFSNYTQDKSTLHGTSDHSLIASTVTI